MKRLFYLGLFICLLSCNDRRNSITVAYSSLPTFNVLLLDSTTVFNTGQIAKGKPTVFLYFSPDCEHCQEQTRSLLANINSLKNTQIYFLSPMPITELKQFANNYHLNQYKNILVANDYKYSFYRIFKVTSYPYTVVYDKHKDLVKLYKGETEFEGIINATIFNTVYQWN